MRADTQQGCSLRRPHTKAQDNTAAHTYIKDTLGFSKSGPFMAGLQGWSARVMDLRVALVSLFFYFHYEESTIERTYHVTHGPGRTQQHTHA